MIKRIALLLSISALLAGCLAKRQVTDTNLFQSPVPSMTIQVDPQIRYLGKEETSSLSHGTDDGRFDLAPQRHETFFFADAAENTRIERFVVIRVSSIMEGHWFYIDDFEKWWNSPMRLARENFGDHSYKTAYALLSYGDGPFANYFDSQEYALAGCYATKILHRLPREDSRVGIWYAEDCNKFQKHFNKPETSDTKRYDAIIKSLDEKFEQAVDYKK